MWVRVAWRATRSTRTRVLRATKRRCGPSRYAREVDPGVNARPTHTIRPGSSRELWPFLLLPLFTQRPEGVFFEAREVQSQVGQSVIPIQLIGDIMSSCQTSTIPRQSKKAKKNCKSS